MLLTLLIQKFPYMYNWHYQFEVSITAICVESQSQKWGIFKGLYVPPLFLLKSMTSCPVISAWLL